MSLKHLLYFVLFIFTLSSCVKEDIITDNQVENQVTFACSFGPEINIFPNIPNNSSNPFYLGTSYRHKNFGAACKGKDNVLYFVTRVANGHGISGGELYWSKSVDEGQSWTPLQLFSLDKVEDSKCEDLRDCTLYYDNLIEKYFLIYTHQYGIVSNDYKKVTGQLKVFICDVPFEGVMYDISPHVISLDDSLDCPSIQTFETFHRVGSYLYLPCYKWRLTETGAVLNSSLLKFTFNDSLPFQQAIQYMNWSTVKDWEVDGDTESTMYITQLPNGLHRMNIISRRSEIDDFGYYTFSDDNGRNWSEKVSIGFQVAGGPRVYEISGAGYMLVAREQYFGGASSMCFAAFSNDGINWGGKRIISDAGSCYSSLVSCDSGKLLLFYGKESGHTACQYFREVFPYRL